MVPKVLTTKQGMASTQALPQTHQRQGPAPSETYHSTLAMIPQATRVFHQLSTTPGSQMTAMPSMAELFMSNKWTSHCQPTANPTTPEESQQKHLPSPNRTQPLCPARWGSSTLCIPLIWDSTGQLGEKQTRACLLPVNLPRPQQRWAMTMS